MRLVMDKHAVEKVGERGVDLSVLLDPSLHEEISCLQHGAKLIKVKNGTTVIFKKANKTDTVFIKTSWAKYAPLNNSDFKGKGHAKESL